MVAILCGMGYGVRMTKDIHDDLKAYAIQLGKAARQRREAVESGTIKPLESFPALAAAARRGGYVVSPQRSHKTLLDEDFFEEGN